MIKKLLKEIKKLLKRFNKFLTASSVSYRGPTSGSYGS